MAHAQKFTMAQVGRLMSHYEREIDENGEHIKYGNIDIDTSKSHLNYDLAPPQKSQYGFLKDRLDEVYVYGRNSKRQDFNVMIDWAITQPKDFPEERSRDFFEKSYEFLRDRYGEENVISSNVHLDETTPHMHFAFIPITYDKKRERYKLSAHEVVNRAELKKFHPELKKHLEQHFGFEVNVINGATLEGNKSIEELKKITASEELKKHKDTIKSLEPITKALEEFQGSLNDIEITVPLMKKDHVTIKKSDYQRLTSQALESYVVQSQLAVEKTEHKSTQRQASKEIMNRRDLINQNKNLEAENRSLMDEKEILEDYIESIDTKPNIRAYSAFINIFQTNDDWNDITYHLKKMKKTAKSLKEEPLREEELHQYIDKQIDRLIKINDMGSISKADTIAIKNKALQNLKEQFKSSHHFKFNKQSKSYNVVPEPQAKVQKPRIDREISK